MTRLLYTDNFIDIKNRILMVIKSGIDMAIEPNAELRKYHEINYEILTKDLDEFLLQHVQKAPLSLQESEELLDSTQLDVRGILGNMQIDNTSACKRLIENNIRRKAIDLKRKIQKRICYDA